MAATMENPPPPRAPWSIRSVRTVRGQHHKFALIPIMEEHSIWFDAGPISIAVEARALGDNPEKMVRGPSIHVFSADRNEEYVRFDVFGRVLHYHYVLNDLKHNIVLGYDPATNGPMIPWIIAALRDRLPTLLRSAHADALAKEVEESGWNSAVLADVEKAAAAALAPREEEMVLAAQGMDWMYKWKAVHPQFNSVEEDDY